MHLRLHRETHPKCLVMPFGRLRESNLPGRRAHRDRLASLATIRALHEHGGGFDGNHEVEYLGAARFLIDELDRFSRFKGRGLNSHSQLSVQRYRQMFRVFEPLRASVLGSRALEAVEIIALLKEPSRSGAGKEGPDSIGSTSGTA